jgi:uncharacterized protein
VQLAEIWRYPVKSLAGERLEEAEIAAGGIPGDRAVHLRDPRDKVFTGRRKYDLVTVPASLSADGTPLVEGERWDSAGAADRIRQAGAEDVELVASPNGHQHDETPLLVATDGALEWLGEDLRRFRPNLVIAGVEQLAERDWPGRRLRVGEAVIDVDHLCERCVMITLDPETAEADPPILTRLREELDGLFALNCGVAKPGRVAVGDAVEVL